MTQLELSSSGGVILEARWDAPPDPIASIVFCHPHPLQGGTMSAPLMVAVTKALVASRVVVLRFNFRGVGRSTGDHDYGDAEQDDIAAAVAAASKRYPDLPLAMSGWSFGAATALRW